METWMLCGIIVIEAVIVMLMAFKYAKDVTAAYREGRGDKPVPKPKKKVKKPEQSKKAKDLEILMANIERYDGTSEGQQDF